MTLAVIQGGGGDAARQTDYELARRCARGERSAQVELFESYKRHVHAILYRILGSNREIEDLVQDSFLQIFHSLGRFRGDAKLSTWTARITTRVALAHIRKRKPPMVELESVAPPASDDPSAEEQAIHRQAGRRMYSALDKLEAKQRVAFALHVVGDLPLKQVAELMDSSLVATKSRVWRARKDLLKRARKDPLLASYLSSRENAS